MAIFMKFLLFNLSCNGTVVVNLFWHTQKGLPCLVEMVEVWGIFVNVSI